MSNEKLQAELKEKVLEIFRALPDRSKSEVLAAMLNNPEITSPEDFQRVYEWAKERAEQRNGVRD